MLYVSRYSIRPEYRDTAIKRFLETGASPPANVTLLGRYHEVGSRSGWAIAETDDPTAMAKFAMQWNDVLTIETHPVINDEQFAKLLTER